MLNQSGSLLETHPVLAREWSASNQTLIPTMVTAGSNKIVWWICDKGHEYKSSICNRVAGRDCPVCAGKKIIKGYNDQFTLYPNAKEYWDFENNKNVDPTLTAVKSHKVVWWRCSENHKWQSKISHFSEGHGCPYCAGQRAIPGVSDLITTNPYLAREWDYEKNKTNINSVMASSGNKYWWKCSMGHSWKATAAHRNCGEGCPMCSSMLRTSFPEKAIYYYIHICFDDTIPNYRNRNLIDNFELDVYIPSLQCAIEYDGQYYHTDTDRDYRKDKICHEIGIELIRIREPECPNLDSTSQVYKLKSLSVDELEKAISFILKLKGVCADINISRDRSKIDAERVYMTLENSFASSYPGLVSEWDNEKNGNLTPYNLTKASGRKVWWKCEKCGYSWEAVVANRAKGSKCPKCTRKKQ